MLDLNAEIEELKDKANTTYYLGTKTESLLVAWGTFKASPMAQQTAPTSSMGETGDVTVPGPEDPLEKNATHCSILA